MRSYEISSCICNRQIQFRRPANFENLLNIVRLTKRIYVSPTPSNAVIINYTFLNYQLRLLISILLQIHPRKDFVIFEFDDVIKTSENIAIHHLPCIQFDCPGNVFRKKIYLQIGRFYYNNSILSA